MVEPLLTQVRAFVHSGVCNLGIPLAGLIILTLLLALRVKFRKGLRNIPGPFFASICQLDRLFGSASGSQFRQHIDYHRKYGSLSDFYRLFDVKNEHGNVFPTVFSVRDQTEHRAIKRPIANAFSLSALVELEPMTDDCIGILQHKFDKMQGRTFDLGEWLHWYAFDVITSITFSNRMGFMEQEMDIEGIIAAIEGRLAYNSVVGEMFGLHQFLLGSAVVRAAANFVPALAKLNSSQYITRFAARQLERYQNTDKDVSSMKDMLARFRYSQKGQEEMPCDDLLTHASTNIFAGSDTTAISLRSMFYYLCRNPRCYDKLRNEVDCMETEGKLSNIVTFAEAQKLPYLQACMKEAMRMHPAVGQLLERVVPDEGWEVKPGVHLPSGTIVGINPWIPARDPTVYGEDVETFRPERWIEASPDELKLMDRNFMAFGSGARTCIGKNISLLEMSKLVPQIIRRYDLELADPKAEWSLTDYWFVKQKGLICRLQRRDGH
ncbi:hypothetical protein HG530_015116 [Fusarium avenaceum]|nr:hypothetical protein HG530_015116 [Fusarium avenaceum]